VGDPERKIPANQVREGHRTVLGNLLGQVSGIYPPEVAVAQLNLEGVSGPG